MPDRNQWSRQQPYTCARCPSAQPPVERCKKCRARKAERRRDLRATKKADGICEQCTAPAERKPDGTRYLRCKTHRLENNALSSASHADAWASRPQPLALSPQAARKMGELIANPPPRKRLRKALRSTAR